MVVAKGALGQGQHRGSLDAFRHGEAGEKPPPALQIGDEGLGARARLGQCGLAAAQLLSQHALLVPAQNVGGGSLVPIFDKGTQQIIVICINEGVATLAHGLRVGKLGAGANGEDGFGNDLALKNCFVHVTAQNVHLMLPQVADDGDGTGDVAIKGGVAHG